jgi:protein TonB
MAARGALLIDLAAARSERSRGVAPALPRAPISRSIGSSGPAPAMFAERRRQADPPQPRLSLTALLGGVAVHAAAAGLAVLVDWSSLAPAPMRLNQISLVFETPPPAPIADAAPTQDEPPPRETISAPTAPAAPESIAMPEPVATPEPVVEPPAPEMVAESPPLVEPSPAPVAALPPPDIMPSKPPEAAAPKPAKPKPVALPPPRRPAVSAAAPPDSAAPAPQAAPPVAAPQLAVAPIVPPRPPAYAAGNRKPDYPAEARRRGLQGTVLLRVTVSPAGTPLAVEVATSSGYAVLDKAAAAAVTTWRFEPGTQAAVPVAAVAEVPVRFRTED